MQKFQNPITTFRKNAATFFAISSLSLLLACNRPTSKTHIFGPLSGSPNQTERFLVGTTKFGEGKRVGLFYIHVAPDTTRVDTLDIYPGTLASQPTTVFKQGKSAIGKMPGWGESETAAIIGQAFFVAMIGFATNREFFIERVFKPLARVFRRSKKSKPKTA